MYKILVIEDSVTVRMIVKKLIEDNPHFTCQLCKNYAEAQWALSEGTDYLVAVVDLNLPDAPHGESVDLVLSHNVPAIVLSGNFDESTRNQLLEKGILDYITKESPYSYVQVANLIERIRKNLSVSVLVVDDSQVSREHICGLLRKFQFKVSEAYDSDDALNQLDMHSDIKLIISAHNLPTMDGYKLVKTIRHERGLQDVIFIGLSATKDSVLTSKFIKSGANDFLGKPLHHEEFFSRIMHNLDSQDMIQTIKDSANLDALTKVYNRRYLHKYAVELYADEKRSSNIIVSMIDADNFKKVNDTYGHKAGDDFLQEFAALLKKHFSNDLVVRYGGEEFTIVSTQPLEKYCSVLSEFMNTVRQTVFTAHKLNITCSIGVSSETHPSLEAQLETADARLYAAKNTGKNRIITQDIAQYTS
jgi:diguanylate cyclase (GGDEF)-like protein